MAQVMVQVAPVRETWTELLALAQPGLALATTGFRAARSLSLCFPIYLSLSVSDINRIFEMDRQIRGGIVMPQP